MSENGPREGTRDLPRSGAESGHRAVDSDSASGAAYGAISRHARRRHQEIIALVRSGLSFEGVAASYSRDHPLEREITSSDVAAAVASDKIPLRHSRPPDRNQNRV